MERGSRVLVIHRNGQEEGTILSLSPVAADIQQTALVQFDDRTITRFPISWLRRI